MTSGCVSHQKYREVADQARIYQDTANDYKVYTDDLQTRVADLESELREFQESGVQTASASNADLEQELSELPLDPELDARIDELSRLALSLSGSGEITPVSVVGGYGFSLTDSVLFDSGSATVKPEGRALLIGLVNDIVSKPYERVWVRGHTDSVAVSRAETLARFPHGNIELSAERAIEVAALLSDEGGLPWDRLVVAGFGSSLPIADNSSPEGKRMNRRVEIFVIEDAGVAAGSDASR